MTGNNPTPPWWLSAMGCQTATLTQIIESDPMELWYQAAEEALDQWLKENDP